MARASRRARGSPAKKSQAHEDSADESEQVPTPTRSPKDDDGTKQGELPPDDANNADPAALREQQEQLIEKTKPKTKLEKALKAQLERTDAHIERLTGEVNKLKDFISKRKQSYKRKNKHEGAPKRALSAYNVFIQEKFRNLSKENQKALQSEDSDAQLQRVPPASLVASTGSQWKELSAQEKQSYEEIAKADRHRYQEQMAQYKPPSEDEGGGGGSKRQKTGYNKFFSAHVLRLKNSDVGVPSERGAVARVVGAAWKKLSAEEKRSYERQTEDKEPNPQLPKSHPHEHYPPEAMPPYGGGRGGGGPHHPPSRYSPMGGGQRGGPPPPPHMMYPPAYHGAPPPHHQGGYYSYPPGGAGGPPPQEWGSPQAAAHHHAPPPGYYPHRGQHPNVPPSQSFEGSPEGGLPPNEEGASPGGERFYESV